MGVWPTPHGCDRGYQGFLGSNPLATAAKTQTAGFGIGSPDAAILDPNCGEIHLSSLMAGLCQIAGPSRAKLKTP